MTMRKLLSPPKMKGKSKIKGPEARKAFRKIAATNTIFVRPKGREWSVSRGLDDEVAVYRTKKEAMAHAEELKSKEGMPIIAFGRDGESITRSDRHGVRGRTVRIKLNYGGDE